MSWFPTKQFIELSKMVQDLAEMNTIALGLITQRLKDQKLIMDMVIGQNLDLKRRVEELEKKGIPSL